jgi:stage II sporulation protein P
MKGLSGRIPLILSTLICLVSVLSGIAALAVGDIEISASPSGEAGLSPLKDILPPILSSSAAPEQGESAGSSLPAESVAVSADPADAVGKIHSQFLSPYSAKLQYGGVYIKNSTGLNIDLKAELAAKLSLGIKKGSDPQVLIVHTHATESYMTEDRPFYTAADKSRTTDNAKNVTAVGDTLAAVIEAGGYKVLHDRTHHDHPAYNGSYNRAYTTINEYLKKYPGIKIVIDLHRDSIAMSGNDKAKPVVEIDGKKAAQVMLVVGSQTGSVTGFPNWKSNFRLAARFQQKMEKLYPGLPRQMLFCSRRYNMHLTTGSMLLEIGTDSNTLEEAKYSAELAGKALVALLGEIN